MKNVLIVSPHFPPVNAPDMQRVRMSLPYYREFGWNPIVLTVDAAAQDLPRDPDLLETLPSDVTVIRCGALPSAITKMAGIGNVALRGFGHLYAAGARAIKTKGIDLVYLSTTMFAAMPLGRLWKRRFGVPYVIDLQDPWFSTYYDDKPAGERPPKYGAARLMHRVLEPFTMRRADAVIAVSSAYLETMRKRYREITPDVCSEIPFGASTLDFEIAARRFAGARVFDERAVKGVYVGRGGPDMAPALEILFGALAATRSKSARVANTRLSFIGTDYAVDGRARETVRPVAARLGVDAQVDEQTARVPYLDALSRLRQADFVLLVGSDDPHYSPSKVYPYIASGRPMLAVVHASSPVVDVIRRTRAGIVVTFRDRQDIQGPAEELARRWPAFADALPAAPETDWAAFEPFGARALTARQCGAFDAAIRPRFVTVSTPCIE